MTMTAFRWSGKKKAPKALVSLVVIFIGIGPATAASFLCSNASSDIENRICGNPHLSRLDTQLAVSYRQALSFASDSGKLKIVSEQKEWIKDQRDICKDDACIEQAYAARIKALSLRDEIHIGHAEAKRVQDNAEFLSQVSEFQSELKAAGVNEKLTECTGMSWLVTSDDRMPSGSLTIKYPVYAVGCLLNNMPVLICGSSILNDLTLSFVPVKEMDWRRTASFAMNDCPYRGG